MIIRRAPAARHIEYDVVLDAWPAGQAGDALHSLIASGDLVAVTLLHGFVGLTIMHSQTFFYVEAGRLHLKQVMPAPPVALDPSAGQYQYRTTPL